MLKCCASCGDLTNSTYCSACQPPLPTRRTDTSEAAWKALSIRARRLQPWCSGCWSTRRLQLDHSSRAWARREAGLPVRLEDTTVLCAACNVAAGSSRYGSPRYVLWEATDGDLRGSGPDVEVLEALGGRGGRTAAHVRDQAKFESQFGGAA